jgi:hypothetical protein
MLKIWTLTPVAIIGASLISSFIWILKDQKVWDWDPSVYGFSTLQLWDATSLGVWGWLNAMAGALRGTPPLLVWMGQFFVPLRYMTGELEPALLSVNIFSAGLTLLLVYCTARRLGTGHLIAAIGALACTGSPGFVGLTGRYMVEMTQCMAAAVMMYVACGIERRSILRGISLAIIGVVLSFLSKSSSMTFVAPFLTYILVASCVIYKHRRTAHPIDIGWLLIAVIVTVGGLAWYVNHWSDVLQHFVDSTTSENWGRPVVLGLKLRFWIAELKLAASPIPGGSVILALLIVAGLVLGIFRSRGATVRDSLKTSVENGPLFALALTGIVLLTILGFSLQINEDTRFLLPLIPLIAVLVSWSLYVIRNRFVTSSVFIFLAAETLVSHAYAHDVLPFQMKVFNYLQKVNSNTYNKALLTKMVRSTCQPDFGYRKNLIIVNYPTLNGNNAIFFSMKDNNINGYHCNYSNDLILESDINIAMNKIDSLSPPYVISVSPQKQNKVVDKTNVLAFPMTDRLEHDPRFEIASGSDNYLRIFRKIK